MVLCDPLATVGRVLDLVSLAWSRMPASLLLAAPRIPTHNATFTSRKVGEAPAPGNVTCTTVGCGCSNHRRRSQ